MKDAMTMGGRAIGWLWLAMGIAGAEPLRTAAEVRGLGPVGMAEQVEVRLTGVVSSVRGEEYPEFTMQDGTGGVVAHLNGPVGERVRPGQRVEITGVTDPVIPHPRIRVGELRVLGEAGLPEPVRAGMAEMLSGELDCTYVEFSGVIRRAKVEESIIPTRIVLDLGPEERRLAVWVSHFDEELRGKLVPDTAVTVRGVCNTWRSASFQPVSVFVVVADPGMIRIDRPAGEGGEVVPVAGLLSRAADDFKAHRERVRGVVTLAWPDGELAIQSADEGEGVSRSAIRVKAAEATGFRPGDGVEAVGFPTRRDGRLVLEDAEFPETTGGAGMVAERLTAAKLERRMKAGDMEARLVRLPAIYQGAVLEDESRVISLKDGAVDFRALLPRGQALPKDLEAGDKVEVTGVCRVTWSERARRFGRTADGFELQLQDAGSIALRGGRAWWTQGRLAALAAGIFVVLVGSVAWSMVLGRRVGKRSDLLVKEIRARHDAELVAAERMRLAADLHDTLSQSLSGAAMQLEVAEAVGGPGHEAETHLALARRLLDRSREDLRRAVWDLGPSALMDRDLGEALQQMAAEVSGGAGVSVEVTGEVAALPERLKVHLCRVAQEALGNALRHGKAGRVDIGLHVSETAVRLVVADDGRGFDVAAAPGPEDGHFGLTSLRERIARLEGRLEISSSSEGTRIAAELPLDRIIP